MYLSITTNFMIIKGGADECLDVIRMYADIGFKNLDVLFCGGPIIGSILMRDDFEEIMHKVKKGADRLGIKFVQSHLPFGNIADPPKEATPGYPSQKLFNEAMYRAIISAAILDVPWAVAHTGTAPRYHDSKDVNVDFYAPFVELANKHGLGFCFENLFDGCYGKGRAYCSESAELIDYVDLISKLTSGNVGICWDFGHGNMMYPNQANILPSLGSRLKMTHVHDNDGVKDAHLAPFYGTTDWAANIRALRLMGYNEAFNFEIMPKAFMRTSELRIAELSYYKKLGEYLLTLE